MTSVLQQVDCSFGRSFKCALRRLIVAHVLDFVYRQLELQETERRKLNINEIITTYTAVKHISAAWDLVPRRVLLKAWLKMGLLSPHQMWEVEDLLNEHRTAVEPVLLPQKGASTHTEEVSNDLRSAAVAKFGSE